MARSTGTSARTRAQASRGPVASERLAGPVLEQAAGAIVVCDEHGRVTRANAAATAICGTAPLRHPFDDVFPIVLAADGASPALEPGHIAGAVLGGRELRAVPGTMRRPDGSVVELLVSGTRFRVEQVVGCVVNLADVTGLRRAEEEQRRYAELVHLSDDAILVWRMAGGIETWNRGAEELFGYTSDEAMGHVPRALLRTVFPCPWDEIVEALRMWGRWEGELEQRTRGGRAIQVSTKLKLVIGDDGAERVLETGRDVTEHRRAELERVRFAEQRQVALDAARMGWWQYDPITRMAQWDARYREIFGVSGDQGPNDDILERIILPEDLPALWAKVQAALDPADPQPFEAEYRIRRATDGAVRWIEAHGLASFDGEGPDRRAVGFVGTVADVTQRKEAEQALKRALADAEQGDRLLAAIMEHVPEGITIAEGPDVTIRMVSRHGRDLLGSAQAGRTAAEIAARWRVYREDGITPMAGHELPVVRALRFGETVTNVRLVQISADGHPVPLLCNAAPLRNAAGEITGAIVAWRDIGALRDAEAAQRLSEQKFATAFAQNPAGIALTRLEDGEFLDVNDRFVELVGYSRDELVGRSARRMGIWPAETDVRASFVDVLARTGFIRGREQEFVVRSGRRVMTEISAQVLEVQGEKAILSTVIDITERKQAERERERLVAELNAVLASMNDGLVVWHADRTLAYMNPAGGRIFGIAPGEWPGTVSGLRALQRAESESGDVVPLEELPSCRALRGENVPPVTLRIQRPDGSRAWLSAGAAPIVTEQGERLGAVVVYRDVSESIAAEERQQDLVRTVSHDLRTPLGALLLQAQMIQRVSDPADPNVRRAEMIVANGQKMEAMIRDLVEMIRLESGQVQIRREELDFEEFALALRERLAGTLETDRILIECPPGLPRAWADPDRLERILVNLLSNGLRHSAPGDPVVLAAAPGGRGGLRITVRDQGSGIAAEDLPHLFERFYRARTGRRSPGLGLGLYISQVLARAHEGRIEVETEFGGGSAFHLDLPGPGAGAPA